jgi:hypothetical protein
MAQLPIISGRRAVKAFVPVNLSVPDHAELDRGLLRGLIRDAGMTVEEFVALVK